MTFQGDMFVLYMFFFCGGLGDVFDIYIFGVYFVMCFFFLGVCIVYVMGGYVCMYTNKCYDAFIYLSSFVVVVNFFQDTNTTHIQT